MNANITKLEPGQKVVCRQHPLYPDVYECPVFEIAEVCTEDRNCYVRTTCNRLLTVDEIEVVNTKAKRGHHPNSKQNLKKGPQSRKKTRVRKLFSLSEETVEWLQQQPIPASQAIDELVALAKQNSASPRDLPKVGSKVQILSGPEAGKVGKVCSVEVRVGVKALASEPTEATLTVAASSLKPLT